MYNVVYICFRVQIFFGDFMQCPPVLDEAVYLVNLRKKSAIEQFGYNAYSQLCRKFYLVEPVREAIGSTFTVHPANARKGQASVRGRKCCIGAGKQRSDHHLVTRSVGHQMKYRPRVCKLRVLAALLILKRAGIHEPGIVNLILRLSFPRLIGTRRFPYDV